MRSINSIIAGLMLTFMFIMMFFSSWNDTAIYDETAHIAAGYSYLSQKEYRLNPEHPPLIKDMAALPLLFLDLKFPINSDAWQKETNGQWNIGRIFLYESGNNPDAILHFSRFPIMLLAIFFGWLLFQWARKSYGDKVGLLTLFFYSFSPTFLAHSRFVTTDLAASFGFFLGIAVFVNFLEHHKTQSGNKHLIIAGLVFGLVQLFKFSLFLLAPVYIILGLLWVVLENYQNSRRIIKEGMKMLGKIFIIGIVGLVVITLAYQFHIWNYPAQKQAQDANEILSNFPVKAPAKVVTWISDKPIIRPLGQYFLGLLMVFQRAGGGNTAYFVGEISANGWWYYFPMLYLLKEHLAFHILTLIAIIFSIKNIIKTREKNFAAIVEWMKDNFILTSGMIFIAIYWLQSITSPLNIGLRHVLPTFPFIYLLVSRQIIRWSFTPSIENPQGLLDAAKDAGKLFLKTFKKNAVISGLFIWIMLEIVAVFPYYLSYFNELAGGTFNGYKIATDSNYDWGQDLKRLKEWTDKNIPADGKIAIDYFGGGNLQYYFGDQSGKWKAWWSAKGEPQKGTWLAVSANSREGAMAKPAKGWIQKPEDTYSWLKNKTPISRAGTSIFIYKF